MINIIAADVYKLRKSTALRVSVVIASVGAVLMALFSSLIPQGKLDESMSGVGFLFSDINMVSILGAVIAAAYICGDFENKTIHQAVAGGVSRGRIIGGKGVVLACSIVLLLLPYALVTGILLGAGGEYSMGSTAIGYLHLLTTPVEWTVSHTGKLLAILVTLAAVYAAQLSICLPLAVWLKKPVAVIAVSYGLSIASGQLMSISGQFPIADLLMSFTPYSRDYVFLTLDTGMGTLFMGLLASLFFIGVTAGAAYAGFRKMEIK